MARKVLVVDDEVDVLHTTELALEMEGFVVATEEDGDKALEKVKEFKPDLIVLDIMLPTIEGYEVMRRLKQDTEHSDTPIILLTACAQEKDKKLAVDLGAYAYVTKPFDMDIFMQIVNNILEKTPQPQFLGGMHFHAVFKRS